jgi:hypothetical protein
MTAQKITLKAEDVGQGKRSFHIDCEGETLHLTIDEFDFDDLVWGVAGAFNKEPELFQHFIDQLIEMKPNVEKGIY